MVVLLNWLANVLGPLETVQAPVPVVGVFPAKTVFPVLHIVAVDVLVAVVGTPLTVTVAFAVEAVHGELLIVQTNT